MMFVEATLLLGDSIKIKGKNASFVIDPAESMKKTSADGIIFLSDKKEEGLTKAENFRVVVNGPGEYEVGGVRVLGTKAGTGFVYGLDVDNIGVFLIKASVMENAPEIKDYDVLILDADKTVKSSLITFLTPSIVILYGENARAQAQLLGKQDVAAVPKFSISAEKLPGEMEVIVLE